jgi:adenylyl-sulfate kinase
MTENIVWHEGSVDRESRHRVTGGEGVTIWLTGLSGSGKSTIAYAVEEKLVSSGRAAYVLDGDNIRHGLNTNLGFSKEDRSENVRRVGEVARLMADAGLAVLVPLISPYAEDREAVRRSHEAAGIRFFEVFVDAPLEVCEERDPKGLYRKARAGEIRDMTGIDAPYEAPEKPDLTFDTSMLTLIDCADMVLTNVVAKTTGVAP